MNDDAYTLPRSLQIGDQLYWLRDGAVIGLTWPGR